ncbi:MAG: prolyl oligopeptidase family serine peptidase, partial [bacterium]
MRRTLLALGLVLLWCVPASAQERAMRPEDARTVLLASPLGTPESPAPAQEQAKRPLRLEDFYLVKSVGSPRISPDGRWVTYTISLPIEETNEDATEAWFVRSDGSAAPVHVQHEGREVSDPRWADDGRLRYTYEDANWVIDPTRPAGPAMRDETPDRDGTVSPDGQWLVRTQEMPAPVQPASAMTDFERRHEERFKGKAFDWYPFLQDRQSFPVPDRRDTPPSEIFLEPASGNGEARQLTRLGLQPGNLRWRPDGGALLFTADESVLDELAYGWSDLFLVTVDGELSRLTDDKYVYSNADFSPDGRWISYVRSFGTDMIIERRLDHGGPQDLYIRPAAGGEPVNLTADWNLDAGSPQWSPDSRYLYFTTGIGGATHLFRVPAAGGPVEQITEGERRIGGLDIDRSFRRMAYTVGEFERPSDIWVADIDGRNERRLTDVHREFLAEVEVAARPAERILYNSYDGTAVEGFLLFPHGYDPQGGPYPLIVANHGGPHSASGYGFNFKNQLFAAHGYFVFLPNFRSSTGYGDAFMWGTWGGWGNKDGEDVLAGVDH